jgi:hypothetical protein
LFSEIQVVKFLETFLQCYPECTLEMVVAALIYIDRLLVGNEAASLTEVNAKGLLHIALSLSAKFNVDAYEKNTKFYGVVMGLQTWQMRMLTDAFLGLLDFQLYVSEEAFVEAMRHIKALVQQRFKRHGLLVVPESECKLKVARSGPIERQPALRNLNSSEPSSPALQTTSLSQNALVRQASDSTFQSTLSPTDSQSTHHESAHSDSDTLSHCSSSQTLATQPQVTSFESLPPTIQ